MNMFRAFMELDKLNEGIFDNKPSNKSNWVSMSRKPITTQATTSQSSQTAPVQKVAAANGKYIVSIVSDKGKLRARSDDGIHGVAFVAFPNSLRQFEGQSYEVDQLIRNGKNYRVSGNIVEI